MQSETGFPSSHQLKSYVASKSRLKLAARAVLSADAGLLVICSYANNRLLLGLREQEITRPTQPPTLSGTGNEYQSKWGDALRLGL